MEEMKPSGNRNPRKNKYIVTKLQSSSPKRRLLIALLVAIILVVVGVLLAVLIPTYMRGKGKPESSSGKLCYLFISHCDANSWSVNVLKENNKVVS